MPLYVNDDEVDALARELQMITGARSKAAAVRRALANEIERTKRVPPLRARLERIKAKARAIGAPNPSFDQKAFTDELWGDA